MFVVSTAINEAYHKVEATRKAHRKAKLTYKDTSTEVITALIIYEKAIEEFQKTHRKEKQLLYPEFT